MQPVSWGAGGNLATVEMRLLRSDAKQQLEWSHVRATGSLLLVKVVDRLTPTVVPVRDSLGTVNLKIAIDSHLVSDDGELY